jgi:hypothetical protein
MRIIAGLFLAFITGFLLSYCGVASAQFSGAEIGTSGFSVSPTIAGGGGGGGRTCTDDTASTNFLARTSGLSNTEADVYCNMIKGLETDGIITGNLSGAAGCGSVLQGLYFTVTNTTTTANLNICGTSFTLTSTAAPTFTADGGYAGNGTSTFLNTNFNPSTNGVAVTQNSNSIGVYLGNSRAANGAATDMGCDNAAGTVYTYLNAYNDTIPEISVDLNGFTFPSFTIPSNTPAGFTTITRTSTTISAYKNNSSTALASSPISDTALALPSCAYTLLGFNSVSGGAVNDFAADTLYAAYYGAGMTGARHVLLANRINTALAIFGKNQF